MCWKLETLLGGTHDLRDMTEEVTANTCCNRQYCTINVISQHNVFIKNTATCFGYKRTAIIRPVLQETKVFFTTVIRLEILTFTNEKNIYNVEYIKI